MSGVKLFAVSPETRGLLTAGKSIIAGADVASQRSSASLAGESAIRCSTAVEDTTTHVSAIKTAVTKQLMRKVRFSGMVCRKSSRNFTVPVPCSERISL